MTTVRELKKKQDELVLVPQDLAILIKPWERGAQLPGPLFDSTGISASALEGYVSLGELEQEAGIEFEPDAEFADILGYGSRPPRRRILQSESYTVTGTLQETTKQGIELLHRVDEDDFKYDTGSGFRAEKKASNETRYFSMFVFGFDGTEMKPIIPWWWLPKVAIDSAGTMSLSMESALGAAVTFSMFEDNQVQYNFGIGGAGWEELAEAAGFGSAPGAIKTVTVTGSPAGGTFTLTYGGQTTSGIAYNATASAVQTALTGLSSVGAGKATVTGTAGGPYTVALDSTLTGALTASGTNLTGGTNPNVTVA